MNFLFFLLRASWGVVIVAVLAGLVSGACNAGLIALINKTLHNSETLTTKLVWIFVGLGLTKLVTSTLSRMLLIRFAHRTVADLRQELSRKILSSPLHHLESVGFPRLLVALTDDVHTIRNALQGVPGLTVNFAILIGCLIYLSWLSRTAFLGIAGLILLWVFSYRMLVARAHSMMRLAREEQETLFSYFRALVEGIKELKIHGKRRETFLFNDLYPVTKTLERHNVVATTRYLVANSCGQLFLFVFIGFLLFAVPSLKDFSNEMITGYVLTFVYMMSPLGSVLNVLPVFGRADIALKRTEELGISLSADSTETELGGHLAPIVAWKRLDLAGIVFAYAHEAGDRNFVLGPIDLILRPGELVFLIGGNGSGKSTLAKLLTGLYTPNKGEIRIDGQLISDANREWYRQHFSVVFSDFFLFENLSGPAASDHDAQARDYLTRFRLDGQVRVENGVFSTTSLSHGQRKRLALLTAYLEDRPIYLFDEWAADQDLEFKEIFYTQLLPELKASGKTVLVITHDDRYFRLADRLIKLENGKLESAGNGQVAHGPVGSRPRRR